MFLALSLKFKYKLGIHQALQFLGVIFLSDNDENSASSLFMVALEGFTLMDVHQRRAECMTRLGDISKGHGDLPKVVDHWETARPLFERSSQTKQVVHSVNWSLYRNQLLYTGCPHLNELELCVDQPVFTTLCVLLCDLLSSCVDQLVLGGKFPSRAADRTIYGYSRHPSHVLSHRSPGIQRYSTGKIQPYAADGGAEVWPALPRMEGRSLSTIFDRCDATG